MNNPLQTAATGGVDNVTRVAIVGAGLIGSSWAAYFLSRGFDVAVTDPAPDAEAATRRFIGKAWGTCERLGLIPGASQDRLSFAPQLDVALQEADFVQESGPEREDQKINLFAKIDAAVRPDVIIASSSSGLLMSRVQSQCQHPERCVIGHPFNPPHLIPLVEVVGGEDLGYDDPARLDFYAAIGKRPIHVRKEVSGHVANRLQAALWREAVHLVAEGVVSVADVDAAIAEGPGLRWALIGPHMTFHLAGGTGGMPYFLEHLGGQTARRWKDLGNPELTPEIRAMIIAGVMQEADGRSVEDLAAERDRMLTGILELKRS